MKHASAALILKLLFGWMKNIHLPKRKPALPKPPRQELTSEQKRNISVVVLVGGIVLICFGALFIGNLFVRGIVSSTAPTPSQELTMFQLQEQLAQPILEDALTLEPAPTATPEPIWVPADKYVAGLPEIQVPATGLICQGSIIFAVETNGELSVTFSGRTETIKKSDQSFVSGSKWAVLKPLNRWGVTFYDPNAGIGQSSQISTRGWIVDNHACVIR